MVVRELLMHLGFSADTRQINAWSRQMKSAQKVAAGVAAAVTGTLAAMVLPAAEIETNIARALTIAGQPVEAFEKNRNKLARLAMDLGDDLSLSAANVSDSYYAVLSTGAKVTEKSFETLAREGLKFAKVGFLETGAAVEFMDGTLKSFNMDVDEASRVTDVMQNTTFLAATNISQLTEAMKTAAPSSAGLGMEIEETSAVLAGFADKLIKGSEAGTALRMILSKIKDGKGANTLKELGIEAFDAQGDFIGLINLLEKLQARTAKMTQEERGKTLLKIAGQEGESKLSALLQTDMKKLRMFHKELQNSSGAVDKGLAQLQASGPDVFKSMYEAGKNFLSVFGFVVMDVLKPVALEIKAIAIGLRKMVQNYPWIAKLTAAILLSASAISLLTLAVSTLMPVILALKMAAVTTFLLLAVKVALAIAAITFLYILIEDIVGFITGNESAIGDVFEAIAWWGGYAARMLKTEWLEFKLWFIKMWDDLMGWAGNKMTGIVTPVRDFFQKILPYQNKAESIKKASDAYNGRNGGGAYGPPAPNTGNVTNTITVPVVVENANGVSGEQIQQNVTTVVQHTFNKMMKSTYLNTKPVVSQ